MGNFLHLESDLLHVGTRVNQFTYLQHSKCLACVMRGLKMLLNDVKVLFLVSSVVAWWPVGQQFPDTHPAVELVLRDSRIREPA
eukprot:1726000-Pyramimonas_sp.AAC.1